MDQKTTSPTEPDLQQIKITALEAAANGVVITDTEGVIIWANPSVSHLTGYSTEELIGQSTNILSSGEHDQKFYEEMWNTI